MSKAPWADLPTVDWDSPTNATPVADIMTLEKLIELRMLMLAQQEFLQLLESHILRQQTKQRLSNLLGKNPPLNPPGITLWAVTRGFPR